MSISPDDHRTKKRLKGPTLKTVIAAAKAAGCQLIGATSRPGGIVELQFGQDGAAAAPKGNSFADMEAALERRLQGNG